MKVTQKRAVCQPQKVASLRLVRGESKRMIDDDDSIQAIALEQPKTIQVAEPKIKNGILHYHTSRLRGTE